MLVKNENLSSNVVKYFEDMILEFCEGNDNYYGEGNLVSFVYEDDERGDADFYGEEEVEKFVEVREFIRNEGGEVKYIGSFNDEDLEYTFKIIGEDIECSFIEGKWNM